MKICAEKYDRLADGGGRMKCLKLDGGPEEGEKNSING